MFCARAVSRIVAANSRRTQLATHVTLHAQIYRYICICGLLARLMMGSQPRTSAYNNNKRAQHPDTTNPRVTHDLKKTHTQSATKCSSVHINLALISDACYGSAFRTIIYIHDIQSVVFCIDDIRRSSAPFIYNGKAACEVRHAGNVRISIWLSTYQTHMFFLC